MMNNNFQISQQADPNKIFITKFSELEGRFDPIFYHITKIKLLAKKTKYLVKKLSDIAFLKRGRFSHRPRNDPDFYGGKYPFIQTGDIVAASEKHGKIQHTQTLNEQGLQTSKLFQADRILITIAANIGDTAILRYPACFPDSIVSITPKDTLLSLEYLHYYLKFTKSYLVDLAPQSAQKNLNLQQLSPTLVVIPPKNIQAEIVAKMDKVYQDKKDKEAQAQNLLDSIDTYLLNELGIDLPKPVDNSLKARIFTKKLSEVAGGRFDPVMASYQTKIYNSKYPPQNLGSILKYNPQYGANETGIDRQSEYEVRYIRITDIDNNGFLKNKLGKTASNIENQYLLNFNDLLLARSGSVGRAYLHKQHNQKSIFAGYLIRFVLDDKKAIPSYIFSYMQCGLYKKWVNSIQRTVAQPNINAEEYKSLKIPLPPLEKQNQIAENISRIRQNAKQLQTEAKTGLEQAKQQVESIILGNKL